ncbi:hypothetical protein [Variovorax sp. 38R]|uniref:hypothetical protein n=1 Tax=Variovorax sp. 38R TaxID=2774875 RepID=UPI00177E2B76|nr:hypothetical protein [Variovorax sp. 38R]QOF80055.1 hypothetical protein IG196_06555 [Variovorax sp. 38R]
MKIKVLFIAIPLCALATFLAFQAGGVCVKERRYWTDSQLIEAAVTHLAAESLQDIKGRRWRTTQIEASPEAVTDFLKRHPDCCSVDRDPYYRNILDVVSGWNAPEVQVTYERNRGDPNWSVERFYTQWLAVSTCGEVLKSTKGWGSKTPDEFPR